MATKDTISSNKEDRHRTSAVRNSSSHDSRYNNLNLNGNVQSLKVETVSSKSILNDSKSSKYSNDQKGVCINFSGTAASNPPDYADDYRNKSKSDSNSWSKSDKNSQPSQSEFFKPEENVRSNKREVNRSNPLKKSSSTLSLRIAEYENSVESKNSHEQATDEQETVAENNEKNPKKGLFSRAFNGFKSFFTEPHSKDSNQSTSEDDAAPETMKFRSSQKLFNPDELKDGPNARADISLSNMKTLTRQALGQIAFLGELYDGHTDAFCQHSLLQKVDSSNVDDFVNVSDIEEKTAEFISNDSSLDAKFKRLGIEGGLKLSFLSGMIKESVERKNMVFQTNGDETTVSLVFELSTKHESLDIENPSIFKHVSSDALRNFPTSTHVITELKWGARVLADLTYKHQSNDTSEIIEEKLKLAFDQLRNSLLGVETTSEDIFGDTESFCLRFYIDADFDDFPKTFEEAITFMKEFPKLIKEQGQVAPISYSMIPVTFFIHDVENVVFRDRTVHEVDEKIIEEIVAVFDGISKSRKLLNYFVQHSYCLEDQVNRSVDGKLQKLETALIELRKQLRNSLTQVRYGQKSPNSIVDAFQNYLNSDVVPEAIKSFCNQFLQYHEKIGFIKLLAKNNVIYIGRENSMEKEHKKLKLEECYEFYCDWTKENLRDENLSVFLDFNGEAKLIFVDLQVNPFARNLNIIPEGNRICHYLNGRYIDMDCLQKWKLDQSKSWVKCSEVKEFTNEKPKKRIDVSLPCPKSFKEEGGCASVEQEWYCSDCEQRLQYDFKHHFYCRCGIAPVTAYHFRCSDENHGDSYASFKENQLLTLVNEIVPNKEVNILLLGETGVGKSTWINSFANYLTHSTLAEAENANPISLIPSQFTCTELVDGKYHGKTIKIGESKNENFQKGESSTQEPQSHVFTVGKKTVRIIDTPGIGDTRGVVTDKENFASILQFISQYDEIHGICVLLKPNNSRLTLVFKYCINELLAHLHKSAAANIAFCFTNARNSFYRPGDTWPILERYTNELFDSQKVKIDLSEETIYCFDNEAFRFLCSLNNGVAFNNDEKANFDKSWEMSVKETQRLLNHFENDVKPHVVADTVSLNEARQIILTAAKPLADITKMIQQNIKAINRQRNEIEQANEYELLLLGKLKIKHIGIKTEPLGYPRTVCCSASCTETKRLPNSDIDNIIYKTVCHEHCYIQNVTPETVPNPALQNCHAMGGRMSCQVCGCSWDTHLHITFQQEEIEEEVEDENVQRSIDQNKSAKEVQQDAIKSLEQRIDEYKSSQADIDRILAKFASFLKKNAILAYNDTIEDYLKLNIRDEKEQRIPNPELLKKMEEQLEQYREEKRILDSRLASGEAQHVKPGEIKALQKELENLPLVGKTFKMLFDAHVQGKKTNLQYGEQYYDPYYNTTIKKRRQAKKNGSQSSVMDCAKAVAKNYFPWK